MDDEVIENEDTQEGDIPQWAKKLQQQVESLMQTKPQAQNQTVEVPVPPVPQEQQEQQEEQQEVLEETQQQKQKNSFLKFLL